jgi:glycosyltransferase involved in cell wall biosynthesis
MNGNNRVTIVVPTTGQFDSRTHRIASTLAARGHSVTVLGRTGDGLIEVERSPNGYTILRVRVDPIDGLPLPQAIRTWLRRLRDPADASAIGGNKRSSESRAASPVRRAIAAMIRLMAIGLTIRSQVRQALAVDGGADVYHGMAYMGVPVALALARRHRAPVLYDARDIYVDAGNLARLPQVARALAGLMERRWARQVTRVVTVNDNYADVLHDRFRVVRPVVVMNCPPRPAPDWRRERRFHETLGLDSRACVVLYHGGISPDRGIEQLIEAMQWVPGATLVLMGYGRHLPEIRRMIAERSETRSIYLLPAAPPEALGAWVGSADISAMLIQPTTLNHRLTTPNKLFEAMAAGVPVVASDLPGMAAIIEEAGCGILVDPTDPVGIAAGLRRLVDDPEARKAYGQRGISAARKLFNWETEADRLLRTYQEVTGRPW